MVGPTRDDDQARSLAELRQLGGRVDGRRLAEALGLETRSVVRAARTWAAVPPGSDRLWPWWLERQTDPGSPAFVPDGGLALLRNVTGRTWTGIGTVASSCRAAVDPRGLLAPWPDGWSLDWWVGAGDRWHLPSREPAVRQSLVGGSPVVETLMRVPSGDAACRAYAVRAGDELGDLMVMEVENRSPVPVAVAFAVRPANLEGVASVERIEVVGRTTVLIDGRPALLLPRPPSAVAGSSFSAGDVVGRVVANRTLDTFAPVECEAGLAQAAFVFPLSHGSSIRVAVPVDAVGGGGPARRIKGHHLTSASGRMPALSSPLPSGSDVARSWDALGRRGLRVVLPAGRLADAVDANRKHLLVSLDGGGAPSGRTRVGPAATRDATLLVGTLDRCGLHAEAADLLAGSLRRLSGGASSRHLRGAFRDAGAGDTGAALHGLALHWRLTRDAGFVERAAAVAAAGAQRIQRARVAGRGAHRASRDALVAGLPPADRPPTGRPAGWGPAADRHYVDAFWSLRGLYDAGELLRAAGDDRGADRCEQFAGSLRGDLDRSLALVAERLDAPVVPAGPRGAFDPAMVESLAACEPLGVLAPDDPRVMATAEAVRARFCHGPAVRCRDAGDGLDTRRTLQLAAVELAHGDRRALDRLRWLLDGATPTFTWPEVIHPALGGGCAGEGHDARVAAGFVDLVNRLLVRETGTDAEGRVVLALCSLWPEEWEGQALEVHDAPTTAGRLSFAVRWHGPRAALLWDFVAHPGAGPARLRVPGLDPSWSTVEPSGEALLGATETLVLAVSNGASGREDRPLGPGPGDGAPRSRHGSRR